MTTSTNLIIGLPDDVTYNILTYIQTPYNIASVLCHLIAPLCNATKAYVDTNDGLWEAVLGGYYHPATTSNTSNSTAAATKTKNLNHQSTILAYRARTQRRSSKRLRRTTAREDVIHAHFVLRDQVSFENVE